MRALIYTRVSKDQRGGRSVAEQEAEAIRHCESEGWMVLDPVESDNDRSGSVYERRARPGWANVKRRIQAGEVEVLVVWEASRATRDLEEFVAMRKLLAKHRVLLCYDGETYDFTKSRDIKRASQDAVGAEHESNQTRDRILRTVRSQAAAGQIHGRRLYGYRRIYSDTMPPQLLGQEPEPAEAAIVVEVHQRFASGESMYAMRADLNQRGVPRPPTRKNGAEEPAAAPWTDVAIRRLLTNVAYIGKRKHHDQLYDADWPPILDADVFAACQARFEDPHRRHYRGGCDVTHLLGGVARCGRCGASMYSGNDRGRPTYVCRIGKSHLARSEPLLDAFVITHVLRRLAALDLEELADDDDPALSAARQEAEALRARHDDAITAFTAGELSAATLGRIEAELLPRIASAERAGRAPVVSPLLADLVAGDAATRWDALDIEAQREVVRLLVDVTVLPDPRPRGSRGFNPEAISLEWRL